jgi:hypothetical protein
VSYDNWKNGLEDAFGSVREQNELDPVEDNGEDSVVDSGECCSPIGQEGDDFPCCPAPERKTVKKVFDEMKTYKDIAEEERSGEYWWEDKLLGRINEQ